MNSYTPPDGNDDDKDQGGLRPLGVRAEGSRRKSFPLRWLWQVSADMPLLRRVRWTWGWWQADYRQSWLEVRRAKARRKSGEAT